jgi:hypothetical protein
MGDNGAAAIGSKTGWTSDDWEEYRSLPWLGRRLVDVTVLLPKTAGRLLSIIEQHADYARKREYQKAHDKAAKEATAGRQRRTAAPKRSR